MSLAGKWCFGQDSENFTGSYDTREEAIEEGRKRVEGQLTIGVLHTVIPSIDAECTIEQIRENLFDEYGECAEGYLYYIKKEQINHLEAELNKVINTWIKRFGLEPDFYTVKNVEYID